MNKFEKPKNKKQKGRKKSQIRKTPTIEKIDVDLEESISPRAEHSSNEDQRESLISHEKE